MKALVFKEAHQPIFYGEVDRPVPATDQFEVEMAAASMNHRDVWMTKGLYPGLQENVIPGSCGAGMVGERAVIINPNVKWGDNPAYPNQSTYTILGMPQDGTFAEYLVVDEFTTPALRPQLAYLLDPTNAPDHLEPVYVDDAAGIVIYRISR